jgi:Flp pilus assembly protein TadG
LEHLNAILVRGFGQNFPKPVYDSGGAPVAATSIARGNIRRKGKNTKISTNKPAASAFCMASPLAEELIGTELGLTCQRHHQRDNSTQHAGCTPHLQ